MIACFTMPQVGLGVERARASVAAGVPLGLALPDGVLCAVSEEAARFGIRAGQSASGARALCPEIRILPYDRDAYEQAARAVWNLLAEESSVVEPLSPEICFVELTGRDLLERARLLIKEAGARAGAPVCAGLARRKLVARLAALRAERGQLLLIPAGREEEFLAPVAALHIPGLDEKLRQRLDRLGIRTLGDLQKLSPRDLQRQFKSLGLRLHRLASGDDGERMRALWPPRVLEEAIPFEDDVADTVQIHEALRRCAEGTALRLAGRHEYSRALALSVSLSDGSTLHQHEKHALPINSAAYLHRAALRLLGRMTVVQPVTGVRLQASDLGGGSGLQLALLDLNDQGVGLPHERREALNKTLTHLGKRYGSGAVQAASARHVMRRISLWTDSLGRVVDKPLEVTTDARGVPTAFTWRGHERRVESILDRWREEDWSGNAERSTRTVYLVQTAWTPFSELIQTAGGWRLGSRFD